MRNLAAILPLKSKLSWKFQCFSAIDRSIETLKKQPNFQKFQLKWNIVKHFARSKQWAALKTFSLPQAHPPPDRTFSEKYFFFKEIYRNIQTFAFKVLQECSCWAPKNGVVQIFFLARKRNMFAGNFVKSERFLFAFREHIIFTVKWVDVRKMSEVFWAKLYYKMCDLFCWILLALRLSARKSWN